MFNPFKKQVTVATHNGSFHADDVFAVATLSIWADKNNLKLKVIRTRTPALIEKADIVVDVGMKYDPSHNRFDHHQIGGAGTRENKIPYAAFGLVWKEYSSKICDRDTAKLVEHSLVIPIDARDNGIAISVSNELGVVDHRTSNAISDFNPTWEEGMESSFVQFNKAVNFAKEIIIREIAYIHAKIEGSRLTVQAIKNQGDPEILVFDGYIDYEQAVSKNKNTKFVVSKSRNELEWSVKAVRDNPEDYTSDRIKMPKEWWGLRDTELEKETGVKDAIFCIKGGWIAKTKTKEAAIEMAKKALGKV